MTDLSPQTARDWLPKHGVQSDARKSGGRQWTLEYVRDFTYTLNGGAHEHWLKDVTVDLSPIVRTWLLLEPFTKWHFVAHPYFIFETAGGGSYCFTIEGKRVRGAPYSGLKGLLNEYELGYIWITEKDCLTMPLTHDAKALYLYPLTLSTIESQKLCEEFLRETHELHARREFYNTLFNNCTGRFAHALNRIGVPAPRDISWYLPGYIDSYLQRLGLIAPGTVLRDPRKDLMKRQDEVWEFIKQPGVARIEILG